MDNTKAMLKQYLSIRVQLKSVGLLVYEIEQLSTEVIAKIVDKARDITVDEFLIGRPDFSSSYPDEYEDLCLIGKKVGQGMSELRSSLDYFVRFLVYANGKTPHKNSEFPVLEDEKSLNKTCLCGLTHDQKRSIIEMQPAYADHPASGDAFCCALLPKYLYAQRCSRNRAIYWQGLSWGAIERGNEKENSGNTS